MMYKNTYMEEQEITTLQQIEQTQGGVHGSNHIDWFHQLLPSTKLKMINIAQYAVQHNIGNRELCMDILGTLRLDDIYISSKQRKKLATSLKNKLKVIKGIKAGNQCKDVLSRYITFENTLLGSGVFGQVYSATLIEKESDIPPYYNSFNFAIKMARQKYDKLSPEYHIANLLNKMVFDNVAQNLPVMADSYSCDRCSFDANSIKIKTSKCIFSISEFATGGDMRYFLSQKQPEVMFQNALFQVMAGIHAIQYQYGIVNKDIKAENILIYNIPSGGYWKYTIYGRDFYVPNYGKLFIVSDFGIAEIFYPQFKYKHEYRRDGYVSLGDRAFVINDGQFEPLKNNFVKGSNIIRWNNGAVTNVNRVLLNKKTNRIIYNPILTQAQKKLIGFNSTDLRFYNSKLVPPLEFAIDTQNCIRMFTGGKKMVGRSQYQHLGIRFSPSFTSSLKPYELNAVNYDDFLFSKKVQNMNLSSIVAGYFILEYFTTVCDYTQEPMSNALIISSINTS